MNLPPWVTIACDFIFNLNGKTTPHTFALSVLSLSFFPSGLINVILLVTTKRLLPDTNVLPTFSTPRKALDLSSPEAVGITPFTLTSQQTPQMAERRIVPLVRSDSNSSFSSVDSETPLVQSQSTRREYSIRQS
ncbi:hypothetical protein GLOTRDRAFT_130791 [Gloeophyllum trabeum ATCC 11539]|nr:uncharacterized protein GLOTRDRAFT_130791 [Gloeophyllum trabeum ATCC 11539]EPQ53456.1 hypothetical protein GLOTRDRAFT_130791 [Gloeophyllum trabeum ATCC 11539]